MRICVVAWVMAAEMAFGTAPAQSGERVLLLGDSHSLGSFGESLDQALRKDRLEVYTFVTGAGSPYYWLEKFTPISASLGYWEKTPAIELREEVAVSVPKVERLLRSYRPDVVVVQAGTELYSALLAGDPSSRRQVEEVIEEFCRAIAQAGAWIYWIAPPNAHPKRVAPAMRSDLAEIIGEVVGRYQGRVFDSEAVTVWSMPYPAQSDGLHYGEAEARRWAEAVLVDFQTYLKGVAGKPAPVTVAQTATTPPVAAGARPPGAIPARILAQLGSANASEELQVKLSLCRKSVIEDPAKVEGGTAFGVFDYEVEKVYQGTYVHPRLRVAHLLLLNGQPTAPNGFEIGKEYYLSLIQMGKYPSLASVPVVSQLEKDAALPVYICRF